MAEWKISFNDHHQVSSENLSSDEEGFPAPPPFSEPILTISNKQTANDAKEVTCIFICIFKVFFDDC